MVRPPPIRPNKISALLKPYMLKVRVTSKNVQAEVIHGPSSTVACAACTKEKSIRLDMAQGRRSGGELRAAAMIGKILGERLLSVDISDVSLDLVHTHHNGYNNKKVKVLIDSLRNTGVKLL